MAAWFNRNREVAPTIASIHFDTTAWKYLGEQQPKKNANVGDR